MSQVALYHLYVSQSPMSFFIQRLAKLAAWLPLITLPMAASASPVACVITSVQVRAITKSLPLSEPEYVPGQVDVRCISTSGTPVLLEFALLAVDGEAMNTGAAASRSFQVELFSDRTLRKALPNSALQVADFSTSAVISAASESRVPIPFHARVSLRELAAAGDYNISRNIGLVYRVTPSR